MSGYMHNWPPMLFFINNLCCKGQNEYMGHTPPNYFLQGGGCLKFFIDLAIFPIFARGEFKPSRPPNSRNAASGVFFCWDPRVAVPSPDIRMVI